MNFIRWLLLCLLMAANCGVWAAESRMDAAAINRAGELRMLSQRIVKAYVQIGMKVQLDVDQIILADSVRRFQADLSWLEDSAALDAPELATLKDLWRRLSLDLQAKPELERAIALNETAEITLQGMEGLTQKLQAANGHAAARLVNLAGRQRMLSQRLAKAYMLRAWGSTAPGLAAEMETAVHEFKAALAELRQYPGNTADVDSEIEELSLQWEWLQAAIATEGTGSYPLIVTESSEAILASADRLTTLYERLANAK